MQINYHLKVCRMCLCPEKVASLISLFEGNAERADKFHKFSGVDISEDRNKHDALACLSCCIKLEKAFELGATTRNANKRQLLKQCLKQPSDVPVTSVSVCRTCLLPESVVPLKLLHPLDYEKIQFTCGVDISDDTDDQKMLLCDACVSQLENFYIFKMFIRDIEKHYVAQERKRKAVIEADANADKAFHSVVDSVTPKNAKETTKEEEADEGVAGPSNTESTRVKCPICSKTYSSCYLNSHIKNVHKKMKRYGCVECDKSYYMMSELVLHISKKHKTAIVHAASYYQLQTTSQQSESLSEDKFRCTHAGCTRRFKAEYHLKAHLMSHSDVRPFVCLCGKSYKIQDHLKNHQLYCKVDQAS